MKKFYQKYTYQLMIIKYLFSLISIILAYTTTSSKKYILVGIIELLMIFSISNYLVSKNNKVGQIVNSVLLFIFDVEELVLYFGSSFVNLIMLSNIASIKDLGGKFYLYIPFIIILIGILCIPIKEVKLKLSNVVTATTSIVLVIVINLLLTTNYSPFYSLVYLYQEYQFQQSMHVSTNASIDDFYKSNIESAIDKDSNLTEQPNVIVIFTEGLSQSVIDDDRNLMPNIKAFENESIHFTNYYNHTFATYRGLIGQLYSGYQLENLDTNSLVSLQSILKSNGYATTFINTEPNNADFTNYLNSFSFDQVISSSELGGIANSMSDRIAYDYLYEQCMNATTPFLTCMYTLDTHVNGSVADQVYGDGSNVYLNKFYNADYQFGCFLEKFKQSSLYDNTILIYTTDHCTYRDSDYANNFGNREYTSIDEIPLCIYYKGCNVQAIDVNGRNSLGLTPTILDLLDITSENYFLGTSLFDTTTTSEFNTVFQSNSGIYTTENDQINKVSNSKKHLLSQQIKNYCAVASS